MDLGNEPYTLRCCPGREPFCGPELVQGVRESSAGPRFGGGGVLQPVHQTGHLSLFHGGPKPPVIRWIVELGFRVQKVLERNLGPVNGRLSIGFLKGWSGSAFHTTDSTIRL